MAHIQIRGRLGHDAELRYTPGGTPVLGFPLAENHRKKNPAGEWVDDGTTWHDITVWDKAAERLADAGLVKGATVLVIGDMRLATHTTRDGAERTTSKVRAREVALIPQPPRGGAQAPVSGPGGAETDPWATDDAPPF